MVNVICVVGMGSGGVVTAIDSAVVVANDFDADWPSNSPGDSLEHPSNNAAAAIVADRHPPTNWFALIETSLDCGVRIDAGTSETVLWVRSTVQYELAALPGRIVLAV
jgi:hypothetical protein